MGTLCPNKILVTETGRGLDLAMGPNLLAPALHYKWKVHKLLFFVKGEIVNMLGFAGCIWSLSQFL